MASRTRLSMVARTVSYKSFWPVLSSMRWTSSVFGGSSLATWSLVRRRMSGATRSFSIAFRSTSPSFSMGVRKRLLNASSVPRNPGTRKFIRLHNSPRWFSIGVPDRQRRLRASSLQAACAIFERGFLMYCASSSTTMWNGTVASLSISRWSRAKDVRTRSAWGIERKYFFRSGPLSTSTRRSGVNFVASARQLGTTEVGATTSTGRPREWPDCLSVKMWVSVWSVFPRPMSSARIPCSPWRARNCIQWNPAS